VTARHSPACQPATDRGLSWQVLVPDPFRSENAEDKKNMATRRRAREIVLQMLYEADINPGRERESSYAFLRSRMQGRRALTDFADRLLAGTLEHRDAIDQRLSQLTTNWSLSRMPITDRNILRMGAYEILFSDTPGSVAITEAIALASRYGDKNSPRFVNGVLDKVLKGKATAPPQA